MNPIQKAWLKVLRPVVTLVNDKMAKKTGIIGRIGKFYSFGPRQFGFHPINRYIAYTNNLILDFMGLILHKYPIGRSLTQNGFYFVRTGVIMSMLGPFALLVSFFITLFPAKAYLEEGTTLQVLTQRGISAPYNALNNRVSAHYTEINDMYHHEMVKRYAIKEDEIKRSRNSYSDKVKKTRFARPGYEYIQAHSAV